MVHSLRLNLQFSATPGCNFHGKTRKKHKMHWTEKSKKPPLLLSKTENQRLNWRKPANRTRHQNRKTAVFSAKTEPKIGQICKTENPTAPLSEVLINNTKDDRRVSDL